MAIKNNALKNDRTNLYFLMAKKYLQTAIMPINKAIIMKNSNELNGSITRISDKQNELQTRFYCSDDCSVVSINNKLQLQFLRIRLHESKIF